MLKHSSRLRAAIALILLVAAASLGMAARLYFQGKGGQVFFLATRLWMLALPLLWFWRVDDGRLFWRSPSPKELWVGTLLGFVMGGVVLGSYWGLGQTWIDPATVRAKAKEVGLLNPLIYLAFAIYFTFINALVEEYIWRWFVYRKCEVLVPGLQAIALAALCFTLHHIIALAGFTANGWVVVLGSLGVFIAGAVWSGCYQLYQSLWICYISHLLADLAIALVGWHLLFS